MSDIDRLKEMDVEEIQKKTFIAPKIIRALLEEDFDKIGSKTKALGFVKILERELELDLSELQEKIDAHNFTTDESPVQPNPFQKNSKKDTTNFKIVVGIFLIAVIGFVLYKSTGAVEQQKQKHSSKQQIESKKSSLKEPLESRKQKEPVIVLEQNSSSKVSLSSADKNMSKEVNETAVVKEDRSKEVNRIVSQLEIPSITIVPKKRVWIGLIYLDNYKKRSTITSVPFELNTSKDQLIVTGHGVIDIDIDGNITSYNKRNKLRFLYKAGKFQEINITTFKKYNRGKNW